MKKSIYLKSGHNNTLVRLRKISSDIATMPGSRPVHTGPANKPISDI